MAVLLAGFLLRVVTLPLAGTEDVQVWKTWSYAATNGLTSMYGVGGSPPERGVVSWGDRRTTVDYPPGTLYGLAVVGHVYRAVDPSFTDSPRLTAAIKLTVLLLDALTCVLLWGLAARWGGPEAGRAAALLYWLNPAVLLDGAVLGYLDPWMAAPLLGALLAADAGAATACGATLAIAVMVKPQAIFLAPIAALLLWRTRTTFAATSIRAGVGFAAAVILMLVPFARADALPNMVQGIASLLRHDMLSGTAANAWWVVTWLLRAVYAIRDLGVWGAWTMTVRILGVSRVIALGYPNPRPIGDALVLAAWAWALWRSWGALHAGGNRALVAAAGAFLVHAYFVLGVQVHENHLYLAIPMLALAAATLPRYTAVLAAVSTISALNLLLFYGIGRGFPVPPRHFTVIDATVVLAIVNCLALVWHARVLARATAPPLDSGG